MSGKYIRMSTGDYFVNMKSVIADDIDQQFSPKEINFDPMEVNVADIVAENLHSSRKAAEVSQSNLAKVFGVSLSQYKKYEQGLEVLKIDHAQKWSLRFGAPFFQLLKHSGYQLPFNEFEDTLNFKWFRANSLTHEYFLKLIDIVHLFAGEQLTPSDLEVVRIEKEEMDAAMDELDNKIYISIAKGLKCFRQRFDISQDRMACLLGISKSTYQQYEKETMKPRFSMTMASRFYLATNVSPLALLKGTTYSRIRYMQEQRMEALLRLAEDIGKHQLAHMRPLVNGFLTW